MFLQAENYDSGESDQTVRMHKFEFSLDMLYAGSQLIYPLLTDRILHPVQKQQSVDCPYLLLRGKRVLFHK